MDIPVTIQVVDLKFSVYVLNVLSEGNVSQNFDLGLFILCQKRGNFWFGFLKLFLKIA